MNYFDKCPHENRVAVTDSCSDKIHANYGEFATVLANYCYSVSYDKCCYFLIS